MRKVKGARRVSAPSNVLAVAVSTVRRTPDAEFVGGSVFSAGACVHWERVAGKWYRRGEWSGTDRADVWDGVRSAARGRKTLTVIARGAADVFTLLGGWRTAQVYGWRLKPLVISGDTDLIGNKIDGCNVRWVGVKQHGDPTLPLTGEPVHDAECVGKWYTALLTGWVGAGAGTYRHTVGSAAWSTWTLRMGNPGIVVHELPDVVKLESDACHGGRSYLWYAGAVGQGLKREGADNESAPRPFPLALRGPVYRLDVRGQYPAVMRDHDFPTRFVRLYHTNDVARVRWWCDHGAVVADVTVRCRRPEYPAVVLGKPMYPIGEFRTTLAGPELADGIDRGEVVAVHRWARYERGPVFRPWAEWVLSLRASAERHHGPEFAAYCKSLAVALSGRLARRRCGWVEVPDVAPLKRWGEWYRVSMDDGLIHKWRSIGGVTQRYDDVGHRDGCLAACYAYVTSYGRVQMRRLRELCPHRSVISQHTDGLLVLPQAKRALEEAGEIGSGEWGRLRGDGVMHDMYLRTPNHYYADGRWVWSGITMGSLITNDGWCVEERPVNPIRRAIDPKGGSIHSQVRSIDLARVGTIDRHGDDGWVTPAELGGPFPADTASLFSSPHSPDTAGRLPGGPS